jgi:hypothetical protein
LQETIKQNQFSMKGQKIILLILFLCIIVSKTVLVKAQDNYPVPSKTDKMLFYLQRSHNRNTIIYDLNTLPSGEIDKKKPVNIYWIRYEEGGRKAELSFLQNKAFGVHCLDSDIAKGSFILRFNCFDKRKIILLKTDTGDYKAFVTINHEMAELISAYIKSENNSLGIPTSMKFIEFHGTSVASGKIISEKVIL